MLVHRHVSAKRHLLVFGTSIKTGDSTGIHCVYEALRKCGVTVCRYGKNTKVLHYIGPAKPWHSSYDTATGQVHAGGDVGNFAVLLKLWWNVYMQHVRQTLEGASVSHSL